MTIVKKFNGLNGSVVTRSQIEKMACQASREEQPHIENRLVSILANYPKQKEFMFEISEPAVEALPASMQTCFEEDDINEGVGLNGVSQQEIFDMVTDMILNTIEKVGHLPWQKEWTGSGANAAMNYVSKKPYSGINFIMLNFEQKEAPDGSIYLAPIDFKQPYYLTFKQIEAANAKLRKGSKASRVFYYTPIFAFEQNDLKIRTSDREKFIAFIRDNGISPENLKKFAYQLPVIKYYNVYRADDCDGLKFPDTKPKATAEPIEVAQSIIDNYPSPPKFTFGGDRAFYLPSMDTVNMPVIGDFSKPAFYYSTYFHEIVHSTGHSKRLDRGNNTRRRDGSKEDKKAYAFEELVAELGAVYLCSEAGILFTTKENSAKYLAHWNGQLMLILKEDNRFFFKAAAAAQKGANYILDLNGDNVPAYLRYSPVIETPKPVKKKGSKPKTTIATGKRHKIIGYALIDNITGEIAASKKTLPELQTAYNEINDEKFDDLPAIVREIILVKGKNKLGNQVEVNFGKPAAKSAPATATVPTAARRRKTGSKRDPQQLSLLGRRPIAGNGLGCPQPKQEAPVTPATPKSSNPKVMKIGGSGHESEYFTVAGEVGKFLQQVEKKPSQSVVITMDGEQGAGKTTTLYNFIEAFSKPGNRCLFLSLEEHPESSLAKDKAEKYFSEKTAQQLDTVAEVDNAAELYDIVKDYDIIFIDSWQKLQRMVGGIRLDEDLRKRFDGKVFVVIFQQTTTGRTKGGAEVVFDGDIIIKMVKEGRFADNYAYFDKNRYTLVPIETVRFNIADARTYNPEEPAEVKEEPLTAATFPKSKTELKFNAI